MLSMKKCSILIIAILLINHFTKAQITNGPLGERFTVRIIADKLSDPWEVTYGPDNKLWVTEAKGYRVSRIDPVTGAKTLLLDLTDQRRFPRYDKLGKQTGNKPWPQGGLMGMALHPQLLTGKPYVYLIYVHTYNGADSNGDGCALNFGGCSFKARLVRYEYQSAAQKLVNPVVLCDTIPQSNDHNGGRLTIAPVNGKNYVFYSIGDMGAGQFNNGGRPNHAQQKNVYEGKVLRFNTEADNDKDVYNKWIPNDNPFTSAVQNAVWSYGHRNPQGITYAVVNGTGRVYSSEHGPFSDDEVNIIEKGKNYGHPLVIGYADNNYNGFAAAVSHHDSLPGKWHTTYPLIVNEKENAKAMGANYRDPIITLYPNSNALLKGLFDKISGGDDDQQWPSEAPSSIGVYTSNAIPGWKNSVLLPTLKGGKLIRLKLNAAGDRITGDTLNYFKSKVRYRDVAVSADGKKIYLAVDSASVSSGPSKENPTQVSYKGCIIEYSYQGNSGKTKSSGTSMPSEMDNKRRRR
jgi:PQQ-dependent dehydrogenase (s-GDH family)